MRRSRPKKLLVEGKEDRFTVPELMELRPTDEVVAPFVRWFKTLFEF
ncbi:MAG TPA: hypothetical protein VNO30_46670 [Kofleriaceae bacterium]|nr:hypothetical protein [Kofleriaceae bacterium]